MLPNRNVQDLKDLNKEVCRRLWHMTSVGEAPGVLSPHLIIPPYTTTTGGTAGAGASRISEQEARFAYAEVLAGSPYYYSVETPTICKYSFSGQHERERSAQSDMSLYLPVDSALTKIADVELKAGNPPDDAIVKDIEKLIREGIEPAEPRPLGNWFHLLAEADWSTFEVLFERFQRSFGSNGKFATGRVSIVMCFCVLGCRSGREPWACLTHFDYTPGSATIEAYAKAVLLLRGPRPAAARGPEIRAALDPAQWETVTVP
jgi:hypothetical protein